MAHSELCRVVSPSWFVVPVFFYLQLMPPLPISEGFVPGRMALSDGSSFICFSIFLYWV